MGNGAPGTSGLAYAKLSAVLPERTLTVSDVFPGETIVFPIGDLGRSARRQIAACFAESTHE